MREGFSHLPSVFKLANATPAPTFQAVFSHECWCTNTCQLPFDYRKNKQTKKLFLIKFPKPDHQNECMFLGRTVLCLYFACQYKATRKCWLVCNARL